MYFLSCCFVRFIAWQTSLWTVIKVQELYNNYSENSFLCSVEEFGTTCGWVNNDRLPDRFFLTDHRSFKCVFVCLWTQTWLSQKKSAAFAGIYGITKFSMHVGNTCLMLCCWVVLLKPGPSLTSQTAFIYINVFLEPRRMSVQLQVNREELFSHTVN